MNYKSLSIWLVLFLVLSACSSDDDAPSGPTPVEQPVQTVLWLVPYVPSLSEGINNNRIDMEKAIRNNRGLNNTRFLVYKASSLSQGELYELMWYGDSLYRKSLKVYTNFTPAKAEPIARLLTDVKALAPSTTGRYGLMIGCHGMGWINVDDYLRAPRRSAPESDSTLSLSSTAPYPDSTLSLSSTSLHPYFGGDGKQTCTNIDELREAVEMSNMHLDFILFDDCYMASVEVAYELRSVTNYVIGSTCEIMNYGLPYERLFCHLIGNQPNYATFMDEFYRFYSNYPIPCGTFSAIDCTQIEQVANLMQRINANYTFNTEQLSQLQYFDGFSSHIFFDMGDYVDHLCENTELKEQMHRLLQQLVPYKTATAQFYSQYNDRRTNIRAYSGITISDPSENPKAANKTETSWWKATH